MGEDYSFENKMQSLLEEEPEHRYDPEQWRRLSRRLKDYDRPPVAWWQKWMPVGFALLLGLLGWQLWQQNNLQQTVTKLSEQLRTSENSSSKYSSEQRRPLVVYDTVYQTIIIQKTVSNHEEEGPREVKPSDRLSQKLRLIPDYLPSPLFNKASGQNATLPLIDLTTTAHQDFLRYRLQSSTDLPERTKNTEPKDPYYITDLITTGQMQELLSANIALP